MEDFKNLLEGAEDRPSDQVIRRALRAVRDHLGMETAYLSEFVDDRSVFRAVESTGQAPIREGDSNPLEAIYCHHVIEGRLPQLMPDLACEPLAASMPVTRDLPVGSHVMVPIHRDDGSVFGSFCCMSSKASPSLNERDLRVMQMFADLSAGQINQDMSHEQTRERISAVAADGDVLTMAFQPIFELGGDRIGGFEALARFRTEPYRTPDVWFAEAEQVGLGLMLELAAIEAALPALDRFPDGIYLSINAAPETVASGRLVECLRGYPADRVVLEITEHGVARCNEALVSEIARLRSLGVRLAIDDAGAGYSGLSQIAHLSPDIVKLDRSLVTGIDTHAIRHSLSAALVHFASKTGAKLVAEGIETKAELDTLRSLGVDRGQGYLLGKPIPLEAALALIAPKERRAPAQLMWI